MNQRFPDEADGVTHVSASLSPALHYLTCTITAWLRHWEGESKWFTVGCL